VEDAEDLGMPQAPADTTKNDFLQWVDIDNDVEIATEETIEETRTRNCREVHSTV